MRILPSQSTVSSECTLFSRCILFLLFLGTPLFVLIGCTEQSQVPQDELPVFGKAPSFSLLDTTDNLYIFGPMENKFRVVNFFFSRCPSICPKINGALKKEFDLVRERDDILFVSVSVDPDHDTPEVLARYAKKYRGEGNEAKWKFLTGSKPIVENLLNKEFQLASGELPDGHNTRIVLIDPKGEIRGFYQGMDDEHLARFRKEFKQLTD